MSSLVTYVQTELNQYGSMCIFAHTDSDGPHMTCRVKTLPWKVLAKNCFSHVRWVTWLLWKFLSVITASHWVGTDSFLLRQLRYNKTRACVRFLGRESVKARIKDIKSMPRDNFLEGCWAKDDFIFWYDFGENFQTIWFKNVGFIIRQLVLL